MTPTDDAVAWLLSAKQRTKPCPFHALDQGANRLAQAPIICLAQEQFLLCKSYSIPAKMSASLR